MLIIAFMSLVAPFTVLADTGSICQDGEVGYTSLLASTARYAFDTFRYGFTIGAQSDGCLLPVSPSPSTFQIWSYIYSHQARLLVPFSMSPEEMYHVREANVATSTWLKSFTGNDDGGNGEALAAIETMQCHIEKAMHVACEGDPSPFKCCSFSQYNTWLRIAKLLSKMIVEQYGDGRCGSKLVPDADIVARFGNEAQSLIATLPADGVKGDARRAALATAGWALKGVCEARNNECESLVNTSTIETEYAQVHAISGQYEATFATSLSCMPSELESLLPS